MRCPHCHFDNIPGVDVCESCGSALSGLDLALAPEGLRSGILTTLLSDIPHSEPNLLHPDASVADAVAMMRDTRRGIVMMVDDDGALVGVFSESDLLRRVEISADLATIPLQSVMTKNPTAFGLADYMARALNSMAVGWNRHLAIVSARRPVGQLSVRHLLRHLRNTML